MPGPSHQVGPGAKGERDFLAGIDKVIILKKTLDQPVAAKARTNRERRKKKC
jgi:hypothetical protein